MFQNGQLLQEVSLQDSELWLGRDDSCKIKLDDRAISRKHALFRSSSKGGLEFEKVSEFGWVKLNGQNSSQSKLKAGDRLEIASYEIRVSSDAPPVVAPLVVEKPVELQGEVSLEPVPFESSGQEIQLESDQESIAEPFVAQDSEPVASFDQPSQEGVPDSSPIVNEFEESSTDGATKIFTAPENVKAVLNFGHGNQYEISDSEIAIGRSQQCHVVLEDRRSSRKHSLIKKDQNKCFLKDLG